MTIHETCGCGAVLDFTSNRNVAGADVAQAQDKFQEAHKDCRPPKPINQTKLRKEEG